MRKEKLGASKGGNEQWVKWKIAQRDSVCFWNCITPLSLKDCSFYTWSSTLSEGCYRKGLNTLLPFNEQTSNSGSVGTSTCPDFAPTSSMGWSPPTPLPHCISLLTPRKHCTQWEIGNTLLICFVWHNRKVRTDKLGANEGGNEQKVKWKIAQRDSRLDMLLNCLTEVEIFKFVRNTFYL